MPAIKGKFYRRYMVLEVFSRKIVGHEGRKAESAEFAALLMRRTSLAEDLKGRALVLHSDNGSAMKKATMLATLDNPGVLASFSRPREQLQPVRRRAAPHMRVPALAIGAKSLRALRRRVLGCCGSYDGTTSSTSTAV